MKLYALKSENDYLKNDRGNPHGYQLVSLNKATVNEDKDADELSELKNNALNNGLNDVKLVEFTIKERIV